MRITSAMAVMARLSRMNTGLTTRSEQDQHHCESTRVHFGHCHETKTLMVWAFHAPRKSSKNILQGSLEGRDDGRSADEMLDGQCQRVKIPFRNLLKFRQSHWTIRYTASIGIRLHIFLLKGPWVSSRDDAFSS